MKRSIKLLSVFLAIVIAMVSLPLSAFAIDNTGTFYESDEGSYYQVKEDVFEIVERRGENSKQIHLADGNIMLVEYTVPIHHLDENGEWQDIDNSISLIGNEYGTSDARVKFAKKITGNESLFTLHDGKYKLTVSLEGAAKKTEGIVSNCENDTKSMTKVEKLTTLSNLSSEIVYNDILDGVDIQYKIISNNIKENIIVNEKKDTYTYTFHLTLNNLIAELNESGDIELSDDKTGELFAIIPKGFMFDANKAYSKDVSYALTSSGNGKYTMTLTADAQWINAEDREFPVTIDPPIYTSSSQIVDTYVDSDWPSSSNGNDLLLWVDETCTSYVKSTSIVTLPASSVITSAELKLYACEMGGETGYVAAHQVTSDWTESLTYNQTVASSSSGATSSTILDYNYIVPDENYNYGDEGYYNWDITAAVKSWYSGTPNYGIALKAVGTDNSAITFSSSESSSIETPRFIITYTDMKGIESYYSTTAQSAGFAGTGYINNANGQLAFLIDTLSAQDSLFGFTPGLVYNSHIAGSYYTASNSETILKTAQAGYGFKLNMSETIKVGFPTSSTGGMEMRYTLTDSDGTEHYFLAGTENGTTVYKDEDGLGLTLTEDSTHYIITDESHTVRRYTKYNSSTSYINVGGILSSITDKNGNRLNFTLDSRGRVSEISMTPNGGSAITYFKIGYNADGLVNIIRNVISGEAYVFYYSTSTTGTSVSTIGTGYLRKIERVHQILPNDNDNEWTTYWLSGSHSNIVSDATAEYTYTSAGLLASAKDNFSQRALKYTYSSGKVSTVYETAGASSTTGQKIGFTYQNGATEIRSSGKDDTYLNTDDIITRYIFDRRGRAVSVYSTNYNRNIIYGASNGEYVSHEENANAVNSLKTSSVIGGSSVNYLVNGGFEMSDDEATGWTLESAGHRRYGTSTGYVIISAGGKLSQTVSLPAGTYTLSAEFTTSFSDGGDALLVVESSSGRFEKALAKNEGYGIGQLSRFDSLTFTLNSADSTVDVYIENTSNSRSIEIDNVMLERNVGASDVSIVSNGTFDSYIRTHWTYNGGTTYGVEDDVSPTELGNFLYLQGNVTKTSLMYQDLWDDIDVTSGAYDKPIHFVVSGFGQATSQVQSSKAKFEIRVAVTYDRTGENRTTRIYAFPFSKDTDQWQFVSGSFTLPSGTLIQDMVVYCDYSNNVGYGNFDDISVCWTDGSESMNYHYYDNGKLQMEYGSSGATVYYYNDGGDVSYVISDKSRINYSYYSNYNLFSEVYKIHSEEIDPEKVIKGEFIVPYGETKSTTYYFYDDFGLCTSVRTSAKDGSGTDKYLASTRSYYTGTSDSAMFGALKSETDAYGKATNYYYDAENGYLKATRNLDGKGVAYSYDALGRMTLAQAVSITESGTPTGTVSGDVGYTYTGALLTGIQSDSTQYTLTYDVFGNTDTIKAGNNTLADYDYNSYNGKLNKLKYGNGNTVEYKYDSLDRVSSIWYNGSEAYRYFYDSNGNLYRYEDLLTHTAFVYRYDRQNRLTQYYEYNTNSQSVLYESQIEYDERSRIKYSRYCTDYLTATDTETLSVFSYYEYNDDGTLASLEMMLGSGKYYLITPTYDDFGRTASKVIKLSDQNIIATTNTVNYTYKSRDTDTTYTGGLVSRYDSTVGSSTTTYRYTYDDNGNITYIYDGNGIIVAKYTYDDLGQLIREDLINLNKTYKYTYDTAGNIEKRETYNYTTGTLGTPTKTDNYTYGNAAWGDLLTAYNGVTFTYDTIGNPITYYNGQSYNFTWTQGRRLATASKGGNSLSFTYNDEGIRTKKRVNGVDHFYTLDGNKILTESWGNELLVYIYDETGSPIGMRYRKSTYGEDVFDDFLFEKNLQGDIIAVYDIAGNKLVSYKYNAYGVCFTTVLTTNEYYLPMATLNPFRYRGYYYDQELEFYYLNSRYYDPNIGRFINADSMMSGVNGDVQGYNLFVYGFNNPVNMSDHTGNWPRWITAAVAVAAAVVTVAAVATGNVALAATAAKVGIVATATLAVQTWHYDVREENNKNVPETYEEAIKKAGADNSISAKCHQFTAGDQPNVKVCWPDGTEGIYNSSGELVSDPRDIGTYNFSVPNGGFSSFWHGVVDVAPWILFGNDDDDTTWMYQRVISLFAEDR